MADNFGTDFAGIEDIDAAWTFLTNEKRVLIEASARRLICPPGGLFYAKTYGKDIREAVADIYDPDTLARGIDGETKKDERVQSSLTTVTPKEGGVQQVDVQITPATGIPFTFTLEITDKAIAVISNG